MEYSEEHLRKAKQLLSTAHIFAITSFKPLSEKFPEIYEIASAQLLEQWDYFVTIASVGLAFMEIADSFKNDIDIDGISYAIQKVLNDWKTDHSDYGNYQVLCNFLDVFNSSQKDGMRIESSIGVWVWLNIKAFPKATEQLKKISRTEIYGKTLGFMIIHAFHDWWKEK